MQDAPCRDARTGLRFSSTCRLWADTICAGTLHFCRHTAFLPSLPHWTCPVKSRQHTHAHRLNRTKPSIQPLETPALDRWLFWPQRCPWWCAVKVELKPPRCKQHRSVPVPGAVGVPRAALPAPGTDTTLGLQHRAVLSFQRWSKTRGQPGKRISTKSTEDNIRTSQKIVSLTNSPSFFNADFALSLESN